jgi:hypothetical protein
MAILFAVVGIMHAAELPQLLRSHKTVWDVVFHAAISTVWLIMVSWRNDDVSPI